MTKTNALTLAIIKRDAIENGVAAKLLNHLNRNSFFSLNQPNYVDLSPAVIGEFYVEHVGKPYFPNLMYSLSKCCPLLLVDSTPDAQAAISRLCNLVGPTTSREAPPDTLRGMFGGHIFNADAPIAANAIHASDSATSFVREIKALKQFGLVFYDGAFVDVNCLAVAKDVPDDHWVEY